MKKIVRAHIIVLALFATCSAAFSAQVDVLTARTAAVNFYQVTTNYTGRAPLSASLKYTRTEINGTVDFYVFDISPKGFVMIAADDQVTPVIAYSLESSFNTDTHGKGIQNWMNHAAAHIYKGIQNRTVANAAISNQWTAYLSGQKPVSAKSSTTAVAPLLTTTWDQDPYYNQLCPYNSTDNVHAVTGCVATTMAQIMKYWNFPAQGTGSYSYVNAPPYCTFNYGTQTANFGATTYNWAAMPNKLDTNNLAVATLMYQCGVAVAMNYGDLNQGGSGAFVLSSEAPGWKPTAQKAYVNYFSYNPNTLTGVQQANYSSAAWLNLMKTELNAGRPIQYEGADIYEGGHTWVCDGYDENDLLHMNWGWSGIDNGYFSVSALTVEGFNFSNDEAALIGIEPLSDLSVTAVAANTTICPGGSTNLTATGSANVNYLWSPSTGLTCSTCSNTIASPDTTTTYTLTIDSAGLSASSQVTINVSTIHVTGTQITNVTCFGGTNGLAKVKVSGGSPAYNYIWNNGNATSHIMNVAAGNYEVTVSDATGCTVSALASITQPDSLIATIQLANANCSLDSAFLHVTATGGTPDYIFAWSTGQQDTILPSLYVGLYSLTTTDASGCSVTASLGVTQPAPVSVSVLTSNTACSLLYGTATANVTGGNENFLFQWNTGENTPSISHLSAGSYSVTVSNASGCSSSDSFFIAQPDTMNISIAINTTTDSKVYGKAVANVTGGTPQYSFLWNTGDSSQAIEYATPGMYEVTITDSKGCAQTTSTRINETTSINNVTAPVSFEVYPNPATTSVTVELTETGNGSTTVEVKNLLGQTLLSSKMAGPQTQIDLSSLSSGVYFVTLTQGEKTTVKQIVKK